MIRLRTFNNHPKDRIHYEDTVPLARRVLKGEGKKHAECNIIFISDKRMRGLHDRYLHDRNTTDVLSFPMSANGGKDVEGEIYISLDQARRQSKIYNVTIKKEIERLVIHGILHLIGYRDKTKREKLKMTKLEDFYLQKRKR
ncbi:MAG TPA: rRNA maturation RNase YbeY [Bacteroidota bacterium]|nr:rRNA maturation RNase YbeY [Bacteroidota bacterium]